MMSLTFTRLWKLTAYYALDNPRPAYDYDCASNTIAYDGYTESGYTIYDHHDEGHVGEGYYDDDYVYASWRLE